MTRSAYWVHFQLPDEGLAPRTQPILEIGPPKVIRGRVRGGVELYALDAQGSVTLQYPLGSLRDSREIKTLNRGFAFRIDESLGREYYLKITSAAPLRTNITLWNESAFQTEAQSSNTSLGIMYGVLMAMIFFNLFQYLTIRHRSYLLYVITIAAQVVFLFLDARHLRFLLNDFQSEYWLADLVERLIYPIVVLSFIAFQRSLLSIPKHNPLLDTIGRWFMFAFGIVALLAFIPDEKYFQISFVAMLSVGLPIALYSNLDAIRRGNTSAVVHMAAMGTFLIGAFILMLVQTVPGFPANALTTNAYNIGQVAQALLLSLSLATHYNLVKNEKEEAQKLAIDNLVRAEKIKDELLANVSHELRTPLFGINGLAESALQEFRKNNQNFGLITKNLELIQASGDRLTMLVNDLLDFSSGSEGEDYVKFRSVDLHTLATLAIAICTPLVGDKSIRLVNSVDPELPLIAGDEDRLQQILVNLVSNAIKFTHAGEVEISATLTSSYTARLSVRDTGIGIHSSDRETIFRSFEKLPSKQFNSRGVGLGLPIAKRMIEMHRSELHLTSELDAGSEFSFELRISLDQDRESLSNTVSKQMIRRADFLQEALQDKSKPELEREHETTILIVDDDEINRVVMSQQLAEYTVVACSNGLDALTAVAESKPDLILLDLMMPGLNGYEVCEKLRHQYSQIELPIILVTAKNHLEDLTEGFRTGANDYLPKPFHNEELRSRVENQLELSALHRVNEDNIKLRALIKSYSAADTELRASRMQLQKILETIDHGFIAFEFPGRVFNLNQRAADFLGTDKHTLEGRELVSILAQGSAPGLKNKELLAALEAWESGETNGDENKILSLDTHIDATYPYSSGSKSKSRIASFAVRLTLFGSDEGTGVLFLLEEHSSAARDPEVEAAMTDTIELVGVLGQAQQNVRRIASRLSILTPEELSRHPGMLQELNRIESLNAYLDSELPETSTDSEYRQQLVTLMRSALHAWEVTTQKSKIELAEESHIWAVSIDDGRLRTRTFDRYSRIEHLPKVPRWREVVRTAYFVLSIPTIEPETRASLERELEKTKDILKRAAIS